MICESGPWDTLDGHSRKHTVPYSAKNRIPIERVSVADDHEHVKYTLP